MAQDRDELAAKIALQMMRNMDVAVAKALSEAHLQEAVEIHARVAYAFADALICEGYK